MTSSFCSASSTRGPCGGVGVRGCEVAHGRGEEGAGGVADGDAARGGRRPGERGGRGGGAQQGHWVREEDLAGLGEPAAPGRGVEQPYSHLLFEAADLP